VSYGHHDIDFLFIEHGFTLDENSWDEVSLDEVILPLLSEEQKTTLDKADFLGCHTLNKEMICYCTRVTLCLLCMPSRIWRQSLAGDVDGEDQHKDGDDSNHPEGFARSSEHR
jgi:hypothetical protein